MERNSAAARHSWARQHAWLLLNFPPFPVGQTIYAHCKAYGEGLGAVQPMYMLIMFVHLLLFGEENT